jgi:hypothetical protein
MKGSRAFVVLATTWGQGVDPPTEPPLDEFCAGASPRGETFVASATDMQQEAFLA